MNEVLMKKIKYLLSFKFNSDDDCKYLPLLEKIIYEFLTAMEEKYNQTTSNAYYNFLLNKLNSNIKSIIIPSDVFYYHPLGFMELNTNLSSLLKNYELLSVPITKTLKEELLRKNYFQQFLMAVKTSKENSGVIALTLSKKDHFGLPIGTDILDASFYGSLEEALTEVQAIELSRLTKIYKKRYQTIYPDGTNYRYFMYFRSLDSEHPESTNLAKILEVILGKKQVMHASLENDLEFISLFNDAYDELLGELRFDPITKKRTYSWWKFIAEYLYFINQEKTGYRKMEYIKSLNEKLFLIYEQKFLHTLVQIDEKEDFLVLLEELKILEENMLYNEEGRLHSQLEHVKILKRMKDILHLKMTEQNNLDTSLKQKKYIICSSNKKKGKEVISSVQPLHYGTTHIALQILETSRWGEKQLIHLHAFLYRDETWEETVYRDLYLCVAELKDLYSTTDLNVPLHQSEIIRRALAERLANLSVMHIILTERNHFLGDFVYVKDTDQCVIYKNKSIVESLERKEEL